MPALRLCLHHRSTVIDEKKTVKHHQRRHQRRRRLVQVQRPFGGGRNGDVTDDPVWAGRRKWPFAIPRAAFVRLARELGEKYMNVRFTAGSLNALQEAAEQHVVEHLHASDSVKTHLQHKTLSATDVELVRRIRQE